MKANQNKWKRFKLGQTFMEEIVIPAFVRNGIDADSIKDCGRIINAIVCNDCKRKHFAGFRRCKNRFCVKCNYIRSLAWVARLMPIFRDWVASGNNLHMLVLTVRDGPDLKERIKFLEDSWRKLYHDDKNCRKKWKEEFAGGIRSLEIKIGKNSNLWHPHMHLILMKEHYNKDYPWIKESWKNITGGNGSVYIKEIKADNKMLKGIVECVKYVLKPEEGIFEDDKIFLEVYEAIKGKRQINTWGMLRRIKRKIEEDIENLEEKKLEAFVCSQCGCKVGELRAYFFKDIKNENLFDIPK